MCSIPDDFGDQTDFLRDQNSGKRGNVKHSSRLKILFLYLLNINVAGLFRIKRHQLHGNPISASSWCGTCGWGFPWFSPNSLYAPIYTYLLYHCFYIIPYITKPILSRWPIWNDWFLTVICSNHLQLCPIYPTLVQRQAGHGPWESMGYLLSTFMFILLLPLLGLNFLVCSLLLVTYFSFEQLKKCNY
jgi:hypothetical protein